MGDRRHSSTCSNLDVKPSILEVFGDGPNQAFATTTLSYTAQEEWQGITRPAEIRTELTRQATGAFELMMLADVFPLPGVDHVLLELHKHTRLTDAKFVEGQHAVRDRLDELGRHRLRDMAFITATEDIFDPIAKAAARLGISLEDLFSDVDRPRALIDAIPSRWVAMELRRVRQSNPQKKWVGNDGSSILTGQGLGFSLGQRA